jgi:streptogramin lyase
MCTNYSAIAVDPLKQVVSTIAGPETLTSITGVAVDRAGNVYMLDSAKFCVFRLDVITNAVSIFAGKLGVQGNFGDGGYATNASFVNPTSIATNQAGDLFVCDAGFNRIRKVSATSGIISAYAGTGVQSYTGEGGPALTATFNFPTGISVDPYGNLLVADTGNHVIRRIDAMSGFIDTVAGNGLQGLTGDCATATIAEMNQPTCAVADSAGNIFIADAGNSLVRVVNAGGVISTLAGTIRQDLALPVGVFGYAGDGDFSVYATLNGPTQLALDSTGNLFVADTGNDVIREITATTKKISTYAGNGVKTYAGDGSVLAIVSFNSPTAIAIGSDGSWYIADSGNVRVRKASPGTEPVYAPPWFAPLSYRVLRSKFDPATKSLLTYCECPNFATYEPTFEIVPPNSCLGGVKIFGGTAETFWQRDDTFFGYSGPNSDPNAVFVPVRNASGTLIPSGRLGIRFFVGGDATNYAG